MKLTIDTDQMMIRVQAEDRINDVPLYSKQGFELLSEQWLKVGWDQKYSYNFTWLGRPIIQLPEDMLRAQEVIYRARPTVIIETGVAHGGSLIYYASLLKLLGGRRVIGIDIEIRQQNRRAIEEHPMSELIDLIEADSVAPATISQAQALVRPDDRVMVFLDSCHLHDHVLKELHAYAPLVSHQSYLVATDGIMRDLHDVPSGDPTWRDDNPVSSVNDFLATNDQFVLEQPEWPFCESELTRNITYWPSAYLRRT